MALQTATIIPPGAGPSHLVLGDVITVKIGSRDTDGALSQIETTCGPQIGPPLHVHHNEDETFYVIEGEFEFVCGGETYRGGPGTVAHLPRGVPHRFKNLSNKMGRILVTMTPGGLEEFFAEAGKLTADEQHDGQRIGEMAARYGLEFVRPA